MTDTDGCGINPHYHRPSDTVGTGVNNLPFLTEVTKVNTATMAVLAVPMEQTDISMIKVVSPQKRLVAQNWPNPFRHSTVIRYTIPLMNLSTGTDYPVTVKMYNLSNQLIRTLVDEYQRAGSHAVSWDGTDHSGKRVPSGIYLYKIEGLGYTVCKKAVFIE